MDSLLPATAVVPRLQLLFGIFSPRCQVPHGNALMGGALLRRRDGRARQSKSILHVFFADRQYTEGPPYPICGEWFGLEITAVAGNKHAARMSGIAVDAKPVALQNQNTFLIRLRDELIDVMVNDEVIFTGLPVPFLPSQKCSR